ncbi:MAG: hypothetical protein QOJ19_2446 [Acidimicrobiia bacterium]|nr:hypothetical protein [Acidimicrobiia bacterium]
MRGGSLIPTRRQLGWLVALLGLTVLATVAVPESASSEANPASSQVHPVDPYISQQAQLSPVGKVSFYKQPWRAYQETVPATQFLAGIGINYNLPDGTDDVAALNVLADAGIRSLRVELGWGTTVGWDDQLLDSMRQRIGTIMQEAKRHGMTPMILLNANDGAPGPHIRSNPTVRQAAPKGARRLVLSSTQGLVAERSGISSLTNYKMAEVLFTAINGNTVELGEPLPIDLEAGAQIPVDTLKYSPLHPVGTPAYEEAVAGWLRYVRASLDAVRAAGVDNFEVEIWNELTFGSDFLAIENYKGGSSEARDLHPGGRVWELARRTTEQVKKDYAGARVIWGFSNTTFYEVPIKDLPPGTDGQSYHPYSTGRRRYPDAVQVDQRKDFDFIPQGLNVALPEGVYQLAVTRESLIPHVLYPATRDQLRPPGATAFSHYFTEQGVSPAEVGITDARAAMEYKAKAVLRVLPFWLNKGITKLELYAAYEDDPTGFGLLQDFRAPALSPPLQALRNLVTPFAGAVPVAQTRPLTMKVWSTGDQPKVFDGDGNHPPLYYRDAFALLPFQVTESRFVVAAYVMGYDATQPPPPIDFQVRLANVQGERAAVSLYDPLTGAEAPMQLVARDRDSVTLKMTASDYPRLIVVDESGPPTAITGVAEPDTSVGGNGGGNQVPWLPVAAGVGAVLVLIGGGVIAAVARSRRRRRRGPTT